MRSPPSLRWLSIALVATTLAGVARAEPSETDRALAQSLFDEGRALMRDGKYADACERFARSQKLDPGGGTLLNLAVCHEKAGKIATAYVEFNEALSLALRDGRADREGLAREHVAALASRVPRVRIAPSEAAPGLAVTIDGEPLPPEALAADAGAIPADPGAHVVEARAPGREPARVEVAVPADAGIVDVRLPPLARAAASAPPPPLPAPREAPASSGARATALVVGGAGLVAIAVGAAFGVDALSKESAADAACPHKACTDANAVSLSDRAVTEAWISDIAIGAGIVAVGVGAILYLTAPRRARAAWNGVVVSF